MYDDPLEDLFRSLELEGEVPPGGRFLSKEKAYRVLKAMSGEDFGFDAAAWRSRKAYERSAAAYRKMDLRREMGEMRRRHREMRGQGSSEST